MELTLNMDLNRSEFKWLKNDLKKGDTLTINESIPILKIPCPLLNLTYSGKDYTFFMLEKTGDVRMLYARSIDGAIIKIKDSDKHIETILMTDIEPLF